MMGNWYAVVRKRRKHPAIDVASKLFSKYIQESNYKKCALITYWCALQVGGVKGIMKALEHGINFIKRKELKKNEKRKSI
jgi:hypothetical protein